MNLLSERPDLSTQTRALALALALWAAGCAPEGPAQKGGSTPSGSPSDRGSGAAEQADPGLWTGGRRPMAGGEDVPAPSSHPFALPIGGVSAGAEDLGLARFESTRFPFGRVFEGQQVFARFRLESAGKESLVIHGVQTSCGCAQPVLWRAPKGAPREEYQRGTPIEVGEWLEVDVVFDSRARTGRQERPIFLYGNVPGGRMEVVLEGEVEPLLVCEPHEVDLGAVLKGSKAEASFQVRSADGKPVALSVQQDALPVGMEIDFEPSAPDGQGKSLRWNARVRLLPEADVGILNWPVRLESERVSPGPAGEVRLGGSLLVHARVVAPVEFAPPHLALGVLPAGARRAQTARLVLHDARLDATALELRVETEFAGAPSDGFVTAELVPRAEGPREWDLQLTVQGLPAGESGRLIGRVLVGPPGAEPLGVLGFAGVAHGR